MISFLLKGLLVGLTVSIPIGPVGLMCLENTVTRGKKAGLSCASGMVLADIVSATLMIIGLGLFYDTILEHQKIFRALTGLAFGILGIAILNAKNDIPTTPSNKALAGLSASSFLLAISPTTFALMLFLFPALGLTTNEHAALIVCGVGLGSAVWCLVILHAGAFIRKCLGDNVTKFRLAVGIIFLLIASIGILSALF
ncbi:MAG: LysE family transporter [Proteobacteria bacterium]|nr:LysE family transporter [Pseudomonadota bacterium]MBQ4360148.1 LysE family transporter [Pseudomonadota bacterium]